MFTMDLKCKGITWVGNIYQKFEAMCMEVDDIVSQDAVKYVENQVQTVGESVKKFCSELVQDMLPPSSEDPVKGTAPDLSLEQNADAGACKKSKIGIEEDPLKVGVEQLSEESEVFGHEENDLSHGSSFSELDSVNHLLPPSSVEPLTGVHPDISLEQNDDLGMYEKSKVCVDGNPMKEKPLPSEMSEVIAPAGKDLSCAPLFSKLCNENHEKACDRISKISPPTSVEVRECNSPSKAGRIRDNLVDTTGCVSDISSTLPSSDSILPVIFRENKVAEIGLTPSSGFLSAEQHETSTTYETESLMGSGNWPEQSSESADLEAFMSTPEIGKSHDSSAEEVGRCNDVIEPYMESIELIDRVKLEESCVLVDSNVLCFVSRRGGKHRSYKDAIASRMRLAKKQEYEQLAIWYGDIDADCNQQSLESFTSTTLTGDLESKKFPAHDLCESEWELL